MFSIISSTQEARQKKKEKKEEQNKTGDREGNRHNWLNFTAVRGACLALCPDFGHNFLPFTMFCYFPVPHFVLFRCLVLCFVACNFTPNTIKWQFLRLSQMTFMFPNGYILYQIEIAQTNTFGHLRTSRLHNVLTILVFHFGRGFESERRQWQSEFLMAFW